MEKLIDLLNEWEEKEKTSKIEWRIDNNPTGIYWYVWKYWLWFASKMIIISKEYWFIKWLVEKDKIDRERFWNSETKLSKYSDFELSYDTPREDYTNILLMELAIQDEPIDFLISILK